MSTPIKSTSPCRPGAWGGAGCVVHEGHEIGHDGRCIDGRYAGKDCRGSEEIDRLAKSLLKKLPFAAPELLEMHIKLYLTQAYRFGVEMAREELKSASTDGKR